jgi:hypothetical protein
MLRRGGVEISAAAVDSAGHAARTLAARSSCVKDVIAPIVIPWRGSPACP